MLRILQDASAITLKLSLGERKLFEFLSKLSGQSKKQAGETMRGTLYFSTGTSFNTMFQRLSFLS